jgi:hypothetical protein
VVQNPSVCYANKIIDRNPRAADVRDRTTKKHRLLARRTSLFVTHQIGVTHRRLNVRVTGLAWTTFAIAGPQPLQALRINVGHGLDWWILAFISCLGLRRLDLEEGADFIGMIDPVIVKGEWLARTYGMLKQYEDVLAQSGPRLSYLLSEMDRKGVTPPDCSGWNLS